MNYERLEPRLVQKKEQERSAEEEVFEHYEFRHLIATFGAYVENFLDTQVDHLQNSVQGEKFKQTYEQLWQKFLDSVDIEIHEQLRENFATTVHRFV